MKNYDKISKLLLVVILILTPLVCNSEVVSRKEASVIAELFFNAQRGQKMATPNLAFTGREFTTNRLFIPFYVYNHPTGGFVIISAENKAFPILAYSFNGKMEAGKLSAGQRALMNLYGRHIEYVRYVSDTSEDIIQAWNDIKSHIASILTAPINVTDILVSWNEVESDVDAIYNRADYRDLESLNYYPNQWIEMISEELVKNGNVIMAFVDKESNLTGGVVTGQQSDFFRIRFSEQPSDAMYRLLPTGEFSQGEYAILSNPYGASKEEATEEIPFSFYDMFIKEQTRDRQMERLRIDDILSPTSPLVYWQGSGRFSIYLPENVEQAILYNIAGMRVGENTYRGTNMADIDLNALPSGFYMALLRGESGKTYSLRLYR